MKRPRFEHVVGQSAWLRCDHASTQLHAATETVRLATVDQTDDGAGERLDDERLQTWIEARGGAVRLVCPPELCRTETVLIADPDGTLRVVSAEGNGEGERTLAAPAASGGFEPVDPAHRDRLFEHPGALEADPHGRLWLLERPADAPTPIRLLAADDLRILATVPPPAARVEGGGGAVRFESSGAPGAERPVHAPVALVDLGTTAWGAVAAERSPVRLWRQPYAGEWEEIDTGGAFDPALFEAVAVAGGPGQRAVVILRSTTGEPNRLAIVERATVAVHELPSLENPLPVILVDDHTLFVGEADDAIGARNLTVFSRLDLGETVSEQGQWSTRFFDGRGLVVSADGTILATTAHGLWPLVRRRVPLRTSGRVETFVIDSEQYGCAWHRVFVDVCLPLGCSVAVSARASDDLYPEGLRRLAHTPENYPPETSDTVLGSRTPDDVEGWLPLGQLDRRAMRIDVPLPPERRELPSGDAWADTREDGPEAMDGAVQTLEGLIKNAPGRYLWLRLDLTGTGRRTPAVAGARITYQRPSLLQHLPSFWRADARAARVMDHWLSQFEGLYTEIDQRIEVLRHLVDPRVCPAEAVDWLASFVAMVHDPRLREGVRRQLVEEATELYRKRGTVPGIERLLSILVEGRVRVVEAFRLRRRSGAVLGSEQDALMRSVLGPALQLGAADLTGDLSRWQQWEQELAQAHADVVAGRGDPETACPPGDLPEPIDPRPIASFIRRYAHRFSVMVFCPRDAELEEIVQNAIEANKPAHTVHELCWMDAGFRLGRNSYTGLGTALGDEKCLEPALVGTGVLGIDRVLGRRRRSAALATFVGAARTGQTTHSG